MNTSEVRVNSWYFYDQAARQGTYGEVVSADGRISLSEGEQIMADFFIKHLQGRKPVIDVGCGLGFPSLVLASCVQRLVAVDAAPAMAARLNRHVHQLGHHGRMSVVLADAVALPFCNASFDGAVISGTLGSLTQPALYLQEMHRVLQPQGIVACAAQNFAYKLQVDRGKPFRWFRMEQGRLSLQVVEYLEDPYRIRDWRYEIRQGSFLYRNMAEQHPGEPSWQVVVEQDPQDLCPDDVTQVLYDEAIMFDPVTLGEAFAAAGFHVLHQELHFIFGNCLIFVVAQRN